MVMDFIKRVMAFSPSRTAVKIYRFIVKNNGCYVFVATTQGF